MPLNKRPQARQDYRIQELKRWRRRLGRPLNLHPKHFPFPDAEAAKAIIGVALTGGDALAAAEAIGRAVWEEERNMADPAEIEKVLRDAGIDAEAAMAKAKDPEAEKLREQWTQEALAKGVFGAPTYVIGDEVLWGQDRLDFLEELLAS
jgi:carboxymethylenebutenolidase